MQLINHAGGRVMAYHTVPSQAGTPGFEHKSMVPYGQIVNDKRQDGNDDPNVLVVACQVAGCVSTCYVPAQGDAEARELHARVAAHRRQNPVRGRR